MGGLVSFCLAPPFSFPTSATTTATQPQQDYSSHPLRRYEGSLLSPSAKVVVHKATLQT